MDCFDYLQLHKDFSQLTWNLPVRKANEIGAGEGHASAFPGKSPPWWQPQLPPVGGSAGPRGRGGLLALGTCWTRKKVQPTPPSSRAG